ncbi:hypothetical protein [Diaphorobacter sp.]|uniref:DUF7338 family protein n=1 Tax=Diaphorobacter sp. TaxID=1934310 RepID=UPI00258ED623|nr:hypothetical protein [Diaphorobacter sp.]
MNAAFTVLGALLAAPLALVALLYGALWATDLLAWRGAIREFNARNLQDAAAAVDCFKRARKIDQRVRIYDATAPLVVAIALLFTRRSAERLPRMFARWDNDASLNGDGWGQQVDGKWVRAVEGQHPGVPWVSYSDPAYTGDAYYARGHHPRSYWARYVWMGWRNRASKLSRDLGMVARKDGITLLSGDMAIGTRLAGHFLLRHGDTYHYKSVRRIGRFVLIRSLGFKLEIRYKMQAAEGPVAAVLIPVSLKGWKGEA